MGRVKVQLDWDSTNYFPLNGFHPLFEFLQNDALEEKHIELVNFSLKQKTYKYFAHDEEFKTVLSKIRTEHATNKAFNTTWQFFDIDDRFLSEISSNNIHFEHSFPLSLGISDFVFHIESVQSLFIPFKEIHGIRWEDIEAHRHYQNYKNYIENILVSESCKAIICNYRITEKNLGKLFPELNPKKIIALDFLNMHLALDQKLGQSEDISAKNRILFTHSYHMNVSSLKQRGLNEFLKLSEIILRSNALKHLKPTMIIPHESPNTDDDEYRGIEIIRGYVANKKYRKILSESSYLFLPSPDIHSKAIIDCVKYNITPIVQRHLGYLELGLNEQNSIFLSPKITDPLSEYKKPKKTSKINIAKLLDAFENNSYRHLTTDEISQRASAGMLDLEKLLNVFHKNSNHRQCISSVPVMHSPIKNLKFNSAPRFSLYSQFNNNYIFSNREYFLHSGSAKTPSNFRDILKCKKDSYGNVLLHANEFSGHIHSLKPIFSQPTVKDRLRYSLQDYKALFLFLRFWYRLFKRLKKLVF